MNIDSLTDEMNAFAISTSYIEHQEIEMGYDYVAIKTGFTSRILNTVKDIDNVINKKILTYDRNDQLLYLRDNGIKLYGNIDEMEFVNSIVKSDGVVVLKDVYFSDAMKVINFLEEVRYCSFCSTEHISRMQILRKDNKVILVIDIDTEN